MRTADSDTPEYRDFCQMAAKSDTIFATFKTNPVYTRILEHVSDRLGAEYAARIKQKMPHYDMHMEAFKKNDLWGGPHRYFYAGFGMISPTTLRYINVLCDLIEHFGSLTGLRIIEIGTGYGGQCKILQDVFDVQSYTLVDLPEVLELNKRYLSNFNAKYTPWDGKDMQHDLVISNYAFSELCLDLQMEYINGLFSHARHGYITMNKYLMPLESYTAALHARVHPEQPESRKNNKILVW